MLYDIEVRPGRDTGFFQYYTETVEAQTSHDAVARVQRSNPGCDVRCTRSYTEDGGGSSITDFSGSFGLALLCGGLWLFFMWAPWVLMGLGGAAGTWLGEKITRTSIDEINNNSGSDTNKASAIILILMLVGGGFGFIQGHNFQQNWNSDTNTEEIRSEL